MKKVLYMLMIVFVLIDFVYAKEITDKQYQNQLNVSIGWATDLTKDFLHTNMNVGAGYTRYLPFLNNMFGIGISGDMITNFKKNNEYATNIFLNVHPVKGFYLLAGAGANFKEHKIYYLTNVGIGCDFDFDRYSISPVFKVYVTKKEVLSTLCVSQSINF